MAENASAGAGAGGFSAKLQGATLFDLIQFECLERTQRIVCVSNGKRTGFLYFRGGNIVHALCEGETGESAVRALLRWESGSFESWEGPWPARESITSSWQHVLLRATAAEDEAARRPKVLSFPTRGDATGAVRALGGGGVEPVELTGQGDEDVTKRTGIPGLGEDGATPITLRMSASGVPLAGEASEDLHGAVAYAAQMADLVGELMGLETFVSMEFSLSSGTCVIARDPGGDLLAAKAGHAVEVVALRRLLRL